MTSIKGGFDKPFEADTFSREKYSLQASNPDRLASRKKPTDSDYNIDKFSIGGGFDMLVTNNYSKKPSTPGISDTKEDSRKSEIEPQPRPKEHIFPIQFK
jgi:hypothetical protein